MLSESYLPSAGSQWQSSVLQSVAHFFSIAPSRGEELAIVVNAITADADQYDICNHAVTAVHPKDKFCEAFCKLNKVIRVGLLKRVSHSFFLSYTTHECNFTI